MNPLKFISDIFKHSTSTTDQLYNDEELKKKNWEVKYNDLGIFKYNDLGFEINLNNELHSINWADIERLQVYKVDLMTIDEICMDITFNNQWTTITEETSGWYQFLERLKTALPTIYNNWEAQVLKSPFEYDLTTIYERADRKMPEKSNFFSVIRSKTEEEVIEVFESFGWTARKSSTNELKLINSWTELVLEKSIQHLLLHGVVSYHPDNTKIIKKLFDKIKCDYKFEFYDKDKIIEQTQNGM